MGVQRRTDGKVFLEIPPADRRDLLVGTEVPKTGGVPGEERGVFGSLVGREDAAGVADEPQRPVGILPAFLPQLTNGCQTRRLTCLKAPAGQLPAPAETIEDHENPVPAPESDERRRHRRVTRWGALLPTDEGDQSIATIIDDNRRNCGIRHLVILPGPPPRKAQAEPDVQPVRGPTPTLLRTSGGD